MAAVAAVMTVEVALAARWWEGTWKNVVSCC